MPVTYKDVQAWRLEFEPWATDLSSFEGRRLPVVCGNCRFHIARLEPEVLGTVAMTPIVVWTVTPTTSRRDREGAAGPVVTPVSADDRRRAQIYGLYGPPRADTMRQRFKCPNRRCTFDRLVRMDRLVAAFSDACVAGKKELVAGVDF